MNEKAGQSSSSQLSELDSLLDELHNATSGAAGGSSANAAANGTPNLNLTLNGMSTMYPGRPGSVNAGTTDRVTGVGGAVSPLAGGGGSAIGGIGGGQYKPPLDSLISDLESSIKLNESRPSMRSSYVIDRNNAQVPSSVAVAASKPPENSSRITAMTSSAAKLRQHPVHETNLDDVMLTAAQNGPSQKEVHSDVVSSDGYYDMPTLTENEEGDTTLRATEGIYDNTNYASVASSEHPYTAMDGNHFLPTHQQQSRISHGSRSSFEESNRASTGSKIEPATTTTSNISQTTSNQPRHSVENGTSSNSTSAESNFQQCFDNVSNKMANLGIHGPSKGVCEKCGMTIHGQIVTAVGKLWHPLCFTCVVCVRELAGEDFFERHGEAFCQSCYQQSFAPKCAHCNSAILDTFVSALGQNWHPECFVCARCSLRLGEGDVSYHEGTDGKAYCSSCYSKHCAPRCRGKRCGGEPIFQQYVSALGGHWHPECFICFDCGKEFAANGNFFEYEGDPYCETHYHQRRGSLCMRCSQPIKGRCITAMGGKRFHPEHFVCVFCLRQLNKGTFREHKSQPYCHPCFVRLFGSH